MTKETAKAEMASGFITLSKKILNLDQEGMDLFVDFVASEVNHEKDQAVKDEWLEAFRKINNAWGYGIKDELSL